MQKKMIPVEEARRIFFAALKTHVTETEIVPLDLAVGRVNAAAVDATVNVPDFRRSAMDGFAVQSKDIMAAAQENPVRLRIAGEVHMGREAGLKLESGEAAYVTTGGMVPEGADAVVMVEQTRQAGEMAVEFLASAREGQNILLPGEDVRKGERVLERGCPIRPEDIGALAGIGKLHAEVYRKPHVHILTTGDELVPADSSPKPGQVRDSNSWALAASVNRDGGVATVRSRVPDDRGEFRSILRHAVEAGDMVLISGGSSMGKRDYTPELIAEVAQILVYGIEIKPGKPTVLAMTPEGKPIIGLPGNPVPALLIYGLFGRHALRVRSGLQRVLPAPAVSANLGGAWRAPESRDEYVRVRLHFEDETVWAEPIPGQSGFVTHLAHADGVVYVRRGQVLAKGEPVKVFLFAGSPYEEAGPWVN